MSVEKPARRLAAARALRWRATKWLRAHPPAPTLAGRQTQFDADQRARHDKADATGVGSGVMTGGNVRLTGGTLRPPQVCGYLFDSLTREGIPVVEQTRSAAEVRRGETDRVKTFTDGVFAIIITILVLELSVPPNLSEQSLAEALQETWPELMAWVISFLITGMYWVWHRDLFHQIRAVNRDVVWLNLLFMLPAALIPFAASVLGEYPEQPIGLHVYGAVLIAASLMRWVLYAYVTRRPELLFAPLAERPRRIGGLLAASPIVVYALAMAVAAAAPRISLVLYLTVPLLYLGLVAFLRNRPTTRAEAEKYG